MRKQPTSKKWKKTKHAKSSELTFVRVIYNFIDKAPNQ